MRILIVYATTEGHTRKLAAFAAERLSRAGHEARVCDAAHPDRCDLAGCQATFLIASVHLAHYQASLIDFAHANHDALNAMPTAFVSVSLSAAGDNPSDLAGLRDCVERLKRDTSWRPRDVHHVAGAMLFSAYGLLTRLAIKYIARRRGKIITTSQDYDLTDCAAFGTFIDRFAAAAASSTGKKLPKAYECGQA
jgi:menaquinone-dependent protoporphyrinogen oxidase